MILKNSEMGNLFKDFIIKRLSFVIEASVQKYVTTERSGSPNKYTGRSSGVLYLKWDTIKQTLQQFESSPQNYFRLIWKILQDFSKEFTMLSETIQKLDGSLTINRSVFVDLVEEIYAHVKTYLKKSIFIQITDISFVLGFKSLFENF